MIIHIVDTGRGMTEEKLGSLFEKFNRLDVDDTGIEGTGIGLNITKKLIELMNGSISVESVQGEDNPANLALVRKILSDRQDIFLLTANEAKTGLDLAGSRNPDLILMDINLPGMNGVTACVRYERFWLKK